MSARSFSRALGVADNNTQNYLGPNPAVPKADYLEQVLLCFQSVNPEWLLTGKGEPILAEAPVPAIISSTQKKNQQTQKGGQGNFITTNHGAISYSIEDCKKERDTYKASVESYMKEVELLREQLAMKDTVIAAKDETIDLLKDKFNRSN